MQRLSRALSSVAIGGNVNERVMASWGSFGSRGGVGLEG
jgi:hypothetical protein